MRATKLVSALLGACVYAVVVFVVGFALGTIRVMITAPALGSPLATLIEIPLMLAASRNLCAYVVRKFEVELMISDRLAMGAVAFVVLIALETLLGIYGFGRSLSDLVQSYREVGPAMGLMAQVAFAAFPALQLLTATTENPSRSAQ
jgi:hypothetical protein